MTRLDNQPLNDEPILAPEYGEGFVCPRCGTQAPGVIIVKDTSISYRLRVQCHKCGYHTDFALDVTDGDN